VFIVTANLVHGIWCTRQSLQRMRDWDAQFGAPAIDRFRVSRANGPAESLTTPGLGPAASQSVRSPAAGLSRSSSRIRSTATRDLVRIEGEAAGQVAVGVGLAEEVVGPSLERGDRVGAAAKRSGGSS
jgi:hypothetical protein